ncbi:hypothetical protein KCU88_g5768, partial [Aureobasidium melanogenum]
MATDTVRFTVEESGRLVHNGAVLVGFLAEEAEQFAHFQKRVSTIMSKLSSNAIQRQPEYIDEAHVDLAKLRLWVEGQKEFKTLAGKYVDAAKLLMGPPLPEAKPAEDGELKGEEACVLATSNISGTGGGINDAAGPGSFADKKSKFFARAEELLAELAILMRKMRSFMYEENEDAAINGNAANDTTSAGTAAEATTADARITSTSATATAKDATLTTDTAQKDHSAATASENGTPAVLEDTDESVEEQPSKRQKLDWFP